MRFGVENWIWRGEVKDLEVSDSMCVEFTDPRTLAFTVKRILPSNIGEVGMWLISPVKTVPILIRFSA